MDNRLEEFRTYLVDLERSPSTVDSYIRSVEAYFKRFDEVSKENMMEFKQWQLEKWKPKTAALRCVAMNVYCDFIGRPQCKVKNIRVHNRTTLENVITIEEYKYFLDCLKAEGKQKLYYMIKFMAGTGCRASELVSLEKKCLKTGEQSLWSKGKVRRILIPCGLIKESRHYFMKVESHYLFPNRYGQQMTPRGVYQQTKKYGRRYGIREEVLHPHSFRHMFAVQFLEKNKNLALLADLMGHENINTTAIYLRLSAEEQKKQIDKTVNW